MKKLIEQSFEEFINEGIIRVDASYIVSKIDKLKSKIMHKGLGTLEIVNLLNSTLREYFIKFE